MVDRIAGVELYIHAKASMVIDHHLSNQEYGTINWTCLRESCAENIFHMLNLDVYGENFRTQKLSNIANYIYLGMIHDT